MKSTTRWRRLSGIALVLPLACLAQDRQRFLILGHGNHACSRVSAWEMADAAPEDPYLQWLLGFVSGVGAMRVRLAPDRASAMWATVRAYCSEHPDEPYSTAVGRTVEALHRRAKEGDRFVIHGVGVMDCAAYVSGVDAHTAYAQWPAGYATGVGSAGVALQVQADDLAAGVRRYCDEAPEAQVATATARVAESHLGSGTGDE